MNSALRRLHQWTTLDDVGLCEVCAAKFDRDLIRQRAWDYSATAFTCHPQDYEALQAAVMSRMAWRTNCWPAGSTATAPAEPTAKRQRRH
ncbi:MAG: hypothetical protein IPK53_10835 [bacterium]|nr:hypothetical protein [bacterium]